MTLKQIEDNKEFIKIMNRILRLYMKSNESVQTDIIGSIEDIVREYTVKKHDNE